MTDDKYAPPIDNWPRSTNSGRGNSTGYSVEGRMAYARPAVLMGQVFDTRWAQIEFNNKAKIGVPSRSEHLIDPAIYELLDFAAAQALMWWFRAAIEADQGNSSCFETRIVEHEITYEFKVTATGVKTVIGKQND